MSNPFDDNDDSEPIEGTVFVQESDSSKSGVEDSNWMEESKSVEVDKAADMLVSTSLNVDNKYDNEMEEEGNRESVHNVVVPDEIQKLNNNTKQKYDDNDNDNDNDSNHDEDDDDNKNDSNTDTNNQEETEEEVEATDQSISWQSVASEAATPETISSVSKTHEPPSQPPSQPPSLNPFDDTDTDTVPSSSNPFDDDDDDDDIHGTTYKDSKECVNNPGCDVKKQHTLQSLVSLGFSLNMAEKKLQITKGDAVKCKSILTDMAINTARGTIRGDSSLIWQSPMTVSINSFVVVEEHTEYTSHITFFGVKNARWSTSNRYSDYAALHSKLKPCIQKLLPEGISAPFPARRLSIFRASEEVKKTRLTEINNWMNEVIMSAALMLNDECRKIIYDFYNVDEKLARIAMNKRQSWAHKRHLMDKKSPLVS